MAEVFLLSLLQGVAEFLPVSSSGHLVIGQWLLGIREQGVRLDVMLHLGTLVSIMLDTRDVQLSEELNELVEQMAKNVHEVWAQSRMEQGWTYGEERSDALKQHPCLIPYEELPEVEKAYDRDTAVGTLKLICKLGFKISRE